MVVQKPEVTATAVALAVAGVNDTAHCKTDDGGDGILALFLRAAAAAFWFCYSSNFGCSSGSGSSSIGRHRCLCLTSSTKTIKAMLMISSVALSRKAFGAPTADHATDNPTSSLFFDQAPSSVSLLQSKMVADETLIQSNRRLSEKVPSQRAQQQSFSSPHSSSGNERHPKAEFGSFNTTLAASIVLGSCCCDCRSSSTSLHDSNSQDATDPASSSLFQFKLSAGQGRGMVCVPIPSLPQMDDLQGDSWYPQDHEAHLQQSGGAVAWPLSLLPQIDLVMVTGSQGHIEYTLSSTYASYGEKNRTWWIRNCFGLSDQEDSIGFPFEYTHVPPPGAMVQVSCPWRSTGNNRLNQDYNGPQGNNNTYLDFVIIFLDEDNDDVVAPEGEEDEDNNRSRRNIIVESHVAQIATVEEQDDHGEQDNFIRSETNLRISSNHIHRETARTKPPPLPHSKQVTLIRPILMDSQSTIRGIRAEAFEASSWSSLSSSVSYQSSMSSTRTADEDQGNSGRSSSTIDPLPPQHHHHSRFSPLVNVQTNKIIQRVFDGQHDNVLAITLPPDYYYSSAYDEDKENSTTSFTEQPEAGPQKAGEDSIMRRRPPSNNNDNNTHTNSYSKDVAVLLHYEMETNSGKVYQRTHIVSSHHPASFSSAPGWWPFSDLSRFPFLGPTLRPRPVWIESTQVTVHGDVRVTLAGLSSSSSFVPPQTSSSSTQQQNLRDCRRRRLLCTIRVGLIVEDIERHEDENKVGVKPQLHSLVDIAAMVTSDAPILMVHVGWIRKGLEALQLSSPENISDEVPSEPWPNGRAGWDVHIEDVLCQDPNQGYQVTHSLQEEEEEEVAVNEHGGERYHLDRRRRLFACLTDRQNDDGDNEESCNSNHKQGLNYSMALTIATARHLMSRVPTQEEREVHDEMRMGRRPEVSWSSPKGEQDEEQEQPKENGSHPAQPSHNHDRRLGGTLTQKKTQKEEGPQPQQVPQLHRFILTHGYCARNTWPHQDFAGNGYTVVRFEDPYQSKSHDDFAFAIRETVCPYQEAASQMMVSGNIVAHSQGGAAALHLQNFYWSCLDNNPYAGHRIQTLGTPFQGTNLAGVAATLGAIFGLGCGSVFDLTQEGATEWLNHIQPWARQRVTYYRTQYLEHPNSNQKDYCHLLTHAIIGAPNDGVVQVGRGILPGGINGGVKMTQCHVFGMRDPPQVEDSIRNQYMKKVAAVPP